MQASRNPDPLSDADGATHGTFRALLKRTSTLNLYLLSNLSRHYVELIARLQAEMRTELRRRDKERQEQAEVAENLRDKIAAITVSRYEYCSEGRGRVFWMFWIA